MNPIKMLSLTHLLYTYFYVLSTGNAHLMTKLDTEMVFDNAECSIHYVRNKSGEYVFRINGHAAD